MAHQMGKRFFIASNIAPHNDKVRSYLRDMEPVIAMGPDALIMSDPGLIMLVREAWPDMEIHLSVQANAVNWAAVKFWERQGVRRVILSRELSLDEVAEIRQRCPDIELEVFVHGALCIAYSGRCLLSGYMTHRDSNQGACTNSCRWKYDTHEAKETPEGDIVALDPATQAKAAMAGSVINRDTATAMSASVGTWDPDASGETDTLAHGQLLNIQDRVFLLQEENRPGEYMPAYEDEHGTYIMNSKDLRAIQHVQRLVDIGVNSLKIEGRTKSHFYVARTAQLYRQAIDDAVQGRDFNMQLMDQLESLASRGYTEGFYRRHLPKEYQNYESGFSRSTKQQFVGEVIGQADNGALIVDVKNQFAVGDEVELMSPTGNHRFTLDTMQNRHGDNISLAPGSGHVVQMFVPDATMTDHALLMKTV